jgi:NADH-quinone oxidoreductase subunit N
MLVVSMFMLVLLVQLSDVFLIYFGIVGLSLSLYPLLSLDKKSHSNLEAVSKYFFLGALASGVMLYGISLIYREVNTLSYSELKNLDFSSLSTTGCTFTLLLGLIFIVFGFLFKLSIVPLQN